MCFYRIFRYILHEHPFKFIFNKLILFKSFCAQIMCMIIGDQKAQVLWMEYCYRKLAEMRKTLAAENIKRVWNSKDVVAVAATIL